MLTTPNLQEENALNRIISQPVTINWELSLYVLIFVIALFSRFYILDQRVMSHDESLHTRFSYNLYNEGNFSHTPLMHGPVLFHTTALSFFLFGDNDFSGRLYTAVLGVAMVMFPLLWRRWLGRWGALLASLMILISPILLYYNRYIRHDTPSILFGMIMAHCILMYINGPPRYRRRAYWLYIFAAAMILNLGSKETAFIYVAIFGSFLIIYFLARLAQHRYDWRGKPLFYSVMLGICLGGIMTLGMYIIVDIVPAEIISSHGTPWADLSDLQRSSFLSGTLLTVLFGLFIPVSTALYAFRGRRQILPWREIGLIILIALITAGILLLVEELSHLPTVTETAEPIVPDATEELLEDPVSDVPINWAPVLPLWLLLIVGAPLLVNDARRSARLRFASGDDKQRPGFWGFLYQFPEVDLIVLIGTLILPWMTAIFPRLMGGSSGTVAQLAQSLPGGIYDLLYVMPGLGNEEQVGRFLLAGSAFLPLFVLMVVIGITWNWKRWLISAIVFHVLFAVFFTSVFTNIAGLATGMVYSLGYWLEQQGVRRGSQPQYYYLLIILPTYEYLPVVGSVTAMFAGVTGFWKMRRRQIAQADEEQGLLEQNIPKANGDDHGTSTADDREAAALPILKPGTAETDPSHSPALDREQEGSITAQLESDALDLPSDDADTKVAQELKRYRTLNIDAGESADDGVYLRRLPFVLLLAWWAILNLVGYSLAGEKMPWLGTHLTMPMILLTAWYFGGVFSRIDKTMFLARGWMTLLILPVFVVCLVQVFGAFVAGDPPFVGLRQAQLERTYEWIASLLICFGSAYLLVRIARPINWMHIRRVTAFTFFALMSLLTFRTAWMASFINYDLPTEFLVYAHAAPAVKRVLDDIEEMSLRITDGKDLRFAYDDEVSWPYSWYFRDYTDAAFVGGNPTVQNLEDTAFVVVGSGHRGDVEPILEDRYYRRDYMRMWWPMQEYFNLTPQRLLNVLDFSPGNQEAADIRRGIFDIWWARDFERYGDATNKDFSLTNWPVSDRMHVYVRKDFASQIWEYGVGDGEVASDIPVEINLCTANWQQLVPLIEFSAAEIALAQPIGLGAAQGIVYVADENSNMVVAYSGSDGQLIQSYGDSADLNFFRPNSVDVLANGDLLVVDTWNYRIQQISAEGKLVTQWGQPGEFGFDAPGVPADGFWGPRDVAVGSDGRIYVSDTGNKRIRVYRLDGNEALHQLDIGNGGSGPGELDEPSGLALHTDGRVFVADTWNRRIAVFDSEGDHLQNFRVRGWYDSTFNRPYLALDEWRNMLYITDPDSNRVLVYSPTGECIGSFGQDGQVGANGQFQAIGGIAVDSEGYVFVSDSTAGKVFKFPPFPIGAVAEG